MPAWSWPDSFAPRGRFGRADFYGWSEDKARQVAVSEREDFGAFVRSSAVRNHAAAIGEMLGLPDYVFPVAGMVAGYPAKERKLTPRLPLDAFVHTDRYDDGDFERWIESYDARRHAVLPLNPDRQRDPGRFGRADFYGWSEDKARQVAVSEREDFGAFVRSQGFQLE